MEEIEDRILEEVRSDPAVTKRLEEVPLHERLTLQDLQANEGWQLQRERFARFKDLATEKLSKRIMRGETVPPEEIAYQRGYIAATEDIFDWPERVETDLGNAALRAWERALSGTPAEPPRQP